MPLPINKGWRVVMQNGTAAIAANKVTMIFAPFTVTSSGVQTFGANINVVAASDGSGFASAIPAGAFAAGIFIDNSTNGYLGGSLYCKVDLTGVVVGPSDYLVFYLQNSDDGGTTWGDNGTGRVLPFRRFTILTAGVMKDVVSL